MMIALKRQEQILYRQDHCYNELRIQLQSNFVGANFQTHITCGNSHYIRLAQFLFLVSNLRCVNQRQHLSAVKNRELCGTALAENGKLCGDLQRNL